MALPCPPNPLKLSNPLQTVTSSIDKSRHGKKIINLENSVAIFIDFKKAFDTVNHKVLLNKLDKFNFSIGRKTWITSYLSNRCQSTLVNGSRSTLRPVPCRVPQGSILGPLLFLLYVNDLVDVIENSKVLLYADDTVVYRRIETRKQNTQIALVQEDLNQLSNWCHLNWLTINIKKTKVVKFPASKCTRLNINLTLDDQPLVSQNNYRYLGIELDHDLSLKIHVTQVNKLASNKLYLLRKIRPYLSTKASVDICKTMLLPVMDYGGLFLTMCTKKELDDLQIIQNNALRCCLKVQDPRDIHLIEMHDITHISFTDDRRLKQLLMCIWRNLSSNFLNYDNAEQQTRATQAPFMRLPIPRTEAFKKSAYYKGCSYWNILPFEVRMILDQTAFKKAITVLITQGHFRQWCCWKHLPGLVRFISYGLCWNYKYNP